MTARSDAAEAAKEGDLKKSAKEAASSASDMAKEATDAAKASVETKSTEAKDSLASEMEDTASALRRAADEVRDGSPQGQTFSYLASGLADMADSVKDQDVKNFPSMVNTFARRNPIAFLGGAALLGFAVTRFAKASEPTAQTNGVTGRAKRAPGYGAEGAPVPARPNPYAADGLPREYDHD
ncbi:MAG: hypothetical protein P1U53_03645 [Sulfitobacter sp.]|nr:hypothetical protein [Sulfitobacter sp.]